MATVGVKGLRGSFQHSLDSHPVARRPMSSLRLIIRYHALVITAMSLLHSSVVYIFCMNE